MTNDTRPLNSQYSTNDHRYLVFSLGSEYFAIPLLRVKEVIASVDTRPVSHSPPHFKGLMDLRGVVVAIIDLRVKMKITKKENNAETSIIILDHGDEQVGVIVDSVDYVANLDPKEVSAPPKVTAGSGSDYITGVFSKDKKMILLLDVISSLGLEDMRLIKKQTQAA